MSIITPKQMVEDVMGILNNVVQDFPEGEREELKAKILDSFSATMFNAPTQEHKITADGAAAVAPACHWIPIDKNTPRGVSMWLINKRSNVAQKSHYNAGEKFFDHWFPLPTFKK